MNEMHKKFFFSTLYYDVFILTLFCFVLKCTIVSYDRISQTREISTEKFTVKLCDSRYYRDGSRAKVNDKDRFQFKIREYICNAHI